MNKNLFLFFIFILFLKTGYSQNLVPNGSFENFTICPTQTSQIYKAVDWFQPHKILGSNSVFSSSSSDYYNSCVDSTSIVGTPNNWLGFQSPMTGNAYIGLCLYTPSMGGNAYREYAEVKLTQTLSAGKKYDLKYFVSTASLTSFSITKFDAYLSNDSLIYLSHDYYKIPVSPQIQYNGRISDTLNWIEVNGSFTATGGENYLTLGNFHDGSVCDTLLAPSGWVYYCAYYYFDDISLVEDTITAINETKNSGLTMYPNPIKDRVHLNSKTVISQLRITDILGNTAIYQEPLTANTSIDISGLKDGMYVVECKFKGGEVLYKKIVVQH